MTNEQAIALGKRLRAAYPAATISKETAELYLKELQGMDFELGQAAVYGCVETCRFWPSVAELRAAYDVEREKRRRLNDEERRREEIEAWEDMPRVPLAEIPALREWQSEVHVGLEQEGTGDCGYCKTTEVPVFRLGKFQVCAGCGLRARAAGEMAA